MGTVTLGQWRIKLARQVGLDPDNLTPRNEDALTQYVQDALRDIYVYMRWEFLEAYYRLRLYSGSSVGSVAVTAGGTAWTGTDTVWDTGTTGGQIKIRADGEVYRVATVDSTTGITATDTALSTLSGESYILYMDEIDFAAAVENIEAMWVASEDRRLKPMAPSVMASHKSMGYFSGHPQFYAPNGRNSSGYLRVELYPMPAYDEILHVRAYKAGTVPNAEDGTSDVPDQFQNVVQARAKMYLHEGPLGKPDLYAPAASEYARQQMMMVQQHGAAQGPTAIALDPDVHGTEPMSLNVTSRSEA